MSNKFYDFLRIVTAVIPFIATLYMSLAEIWSLPYSDAVVATCTALTTFIAALTKILSNKYFSDKEIIDQTGAEE